MTKLPPIPNVRISQLPRADGMVMAEPTVASQNAMPLVWLGAKSSGGLALPCAHPTRSQLYAPRGVWLDRQRLIVCDSGNHRVLIWSDVPSVDGQAADIVLGQMDFETEGPACGNQNYANGFHLPTGVLVADGKLLVADAWHHRVLVWNQVPTESQTPPDYAIGQSNLTEVLPNRGSTPTPISMYWPYGISFIAGRLYVTDTGNRRVLAWNGIPSAGAPADLVLGQVDAYTAEENRGAPVASNSFRWPHAIAGDANHLWIADAGNHRILGWNQHPHEDRPADYVLGQADMISAREWPYDVQGNCRLRFPYGIDGQDSCLAVADTANNRILFWQLPVSKEAFAPAKDVIGQMDFAKFGENHWQAVTDNSLCWPYGISLCDDHLAIADSGNNRVMIWQCSEIVSGVSSSHRSNESRAESCV